MLILSVVLVIAGNLLEQGFGAKIVTKGLDYQIAVSSRRVLLVVSDRLLLELEEGSEGANQEEGDNDDHYDLALEFSLWRHVSILPDDVRRLGCLFEGDQLAIEPVLGALYLAFPVLLALQVACALISFLGLERNEGRHGSREPVPLTLHLALDLGLKASQLLNLSRGYALASLL